MPFDKASGKYVAPDVGVIHAKKDELTRIFGEDGYKELSNLASVIQEQAKVGTSNFLGFAQRARESGMLLSTVKSFLRGDRSIVGPMLSEGGSTILFAMGMGKVLTSPRNIAYAATLADPRVPEFIKIGAFRNIAQQYVQWHEAAQNSMDDYERERAAAAHEDNKEYLQTIKGMNAQ